MLTSGLVALLSCVGTALMAARPPNASRWSVPALRRLRPTTGGSTTGLGSATASIWPGWSIRRWRIARRSRSRDGPVLRQPRRDRHADRGSSDQVHPDVAIVDFLFWFGYGTVGIDARRIRTDEDRLAMLEFGLDLLDRIDVPIVVGDIPDMSASGGVLMPSRFRPRDADPHQSSHPRLGRRTRPGRRLPCRICTVDSAARRSPGTSCCPRSNATGCCSVIAHPTLGGLLAMVAELDAGPG